MGYSFGGDWRIIADLAVWSMAVLANSVLAYLCIILMRRSKDRRAAYLAVCLSCLLLTVHGSLCIGDIFFEYNTDSSPNLRTRANLLSAMAFFSTWSYSFFYLSPIIFLEDRMRHITRRTMFSFEVNLFRIGYAYFGLMLVISTVYPVLLAKALALRVEWDNLGQEALAVVAIALVSAEKKAAVASYIFYGFWYFSAAMATIIAAVTYRRMKRMALRDRITSRISFIVMPLYYATMASELFFTIFDSSEVSLTPSAEVDKLSLANDILALSFHTAVMITFVIIGFESQLWEIKDNGHIHALETLKGRPFGSYVKFDGRKDESL